MFASARPESQIRPGARLPRVTPQTTDLAEIVLSVLAAAWAGAGQPRPVPCPVDGRCARCGISGPVAPLRTVVSKVFTAFDDWAEPAGVGMCATCAWGYADPALRTKAHLVTADPVTFHPCSPAELYQVLSTGALHPGTAVVVPLRPGRKHLLPSSTWGQVTVDDARLPWTTQDAHLLRLVAELRSDGFGSRMLTCPAPPFTALRRLPAARWGDVMERWRELEPWRTPASPWLPLALHLTLPAPEEKR